MCALNVVKGMILKMKKKIILFAIYIFAIVCLLSNEITINNERTITLASKIEDSTHVPKGYSLVFNDEFNGNTLNNKNWSLNSWQCSGNNLPCEEPTVSNGSVNFTTYFDENGILHRPYALQSACNPQNKAGYNCVLPTASNNGSQPVFWAFKQGYAEIRMKTDYGQEWAAWWLKGNTLINDRVQKNWAAEVDMMEACAWSGCEKYDADGVTTGGIHLWKAPWNNDTPTTHANKSGMTPSSIGNNQWTIFGFLWTENRMTWLINGQEMGHIDLSSLSNEWNESMTVGTNAFSDPMFVMLNGGASLNGNGNGLDQTKFPKTTSVDYIRIYQHPGDKFYQAPSPSSKLKDGTVGEEYYEKIPDGCIAKTLPAGLTQKNNIIKGVPTSVSTTTIDFDCSSTFQQGESHSAQSTITINDKKNMNVSQNNQSDNNPSEVVSVPSTSLYGSIMIIILGIICIIVSIVVTRKLTRSNSK